LTQRVTLTTVDVLQAMRRRAVTSPHSEGLPSIRHISVNTSLAVIAIIVYGSLVPFDLTWSRARTLHEWIAAVPFTPWRQYADGTDLLVNVAVGLLLGFVLMGAERPVGRPNVLATSLAVLKVAGLSAMLSGGLELLQVLSPTRQSSWNDVWSETCGAASGAMLCAFVGPTVTEWFRDGASERRLGPFAGWVLQLYVPVYLLARLTPFGTGQAAEIAAKYNGGRAVMLASIHPADALLLTLFDFAGAALLAVPVGAVAVIGWRARRPVRSLAHAAVVAAAVVASAGLVEAFVWPRGVAARHLVAAALGAGVGMAVAFGFVRGRFHVMAHTPRARRWCAALAALWTVALLAHAWYPFNFQLSAEIVGGRLSRMSLAPFGFYYWYAIYIVSPFAAAHETLLNVLMSIPLGFLVRAAWPGIGAPRGQRPNRSVLALALLVPVAIEAGQLFLPMRFADITDAIAGIAGVLAGARLASAIASRLLLASIAPRRRVRASATGRPLRVAAAG
jgi:glycopeptide antibiotics resistance protein